MDVKNKHITVAGLGNSGFNAALVLCRNGAKVKATDACDCPAAREAAASLSAEGVIVELGRHTEEFIKDSDMIVVSPGIDRSSCIFEWSAKYSIPVIGEMELGYNFCKGKIIAVTGTNGKSTVTTLIGKMFEDAGKDCVVCGNIGNCLCQEISRVNKNTYVVLEVSSFQLETIKSFKPSIAVILNITDDHMDRYNNLDEYFAAKLKIFTNQDELDTLVVNYDAENIRHLGNITRSKTLFYSRFSKTNGTYVRDGIIYGLSDGVEKKICSMDKIKLKGLHNLENVLASSLVGLKSGLDEKSIAGTIEKFKGLSHRTETVDIIENVEYIDDSKGTTVDSTYRAIEACSGPVILIAGGKDKHSDYSYVREIVKKKVKALVLIGEARDAIKDALRGAADIVEAIDMSDAVSKSREIAREGWTVLLSPMCSSFDMFKDYKERGDAFRKAVIMIRDNTTEVRPSR